MGKRGPGGGGDKARPKRKSRWSLPRRRPEETDVDYLIRWIERLPVASGILAGSHIVLQPWQQDFLRDAYRPAVTQAILSVPRKNGKTGLAAALSLAHLCGPMAEQQGEVYSAANDKAQAAITYRAMRAIVERVPALEDRLIIRDHDKSIEDAVTGSRYQALSADVPRKHGLSASFIVYDELGQAKSRDLFDVLATSGGARENPKLLVISTQAADDSHVLSELIDDALGADDPSIAYAVWAAEPDADPYTEETWAACNPALGTFRSLEEMQSAARRAARIPSQRAAFRNLYLNQRVSPDTSFLPPEEWHECAGEFDPDLLAGAPCYLGLDLAKTRDLNALIAYFPEEHAVLDWVWAAGDQVDAASAPYQAWVEAGWLLQSGTRAVNKREIAYQIARVCEDYDVRGILCDRWGIDELQRVFDEEGIYADLVPFGQGYKDMSPAVAVLEQAVLERRIVHRGNPLMTWSFGNIEIDTDPAGNRKFTKKRAREAIDPMVALVMALAGAEHAPPVYSFRDSVVSLS